MASFKHLIIMWTSLPADSPKNYACLPAFGKREERGAPKTVSSRRFFVLVGRRISLREEEIDVVAFLGEVESAA